MGSCQNQCLNNLGESYQFLMSNEFVADRVRPDLSQVYIIDFERRVKKFAHPCYLGKVSVHQLKEAFKDIKTFDKLGNPLSVCHRLLTSPFFTKFQLTGNIKDKVFFDSLKKDIISDGKRLSKNHLHNSRSHDSIGPNRSIRNSGRSSCGSSSVINFTSQSFTGGEEPQRLRRRKLNDIEQTALKLENAWISVEALILYGIVHCNGTDHEKSEVFHRVVAPENNDVVTITDKDLVTAMRFMILTATIIEQMTRDLIETPGEKVNYQIYEKKIAKYAPTFDGMMEDFENSVFGVFYNRRNKE